MPAPVASFTGGVMIFVVGNHHHEIRLAQNDSLLLLNPSVYYQRSRRPLSVNYIIAKIIRNTSVVETRLDYNDWRNPRSMSVAVRERLIREYKKRTKIRVL
jgi:hypothetical protein